jgi:SWIM zinc finger
MSTSIQSYRYAHASALQHSAQSHLTLATSDAGGATNPHFFEGQLLQPRLISELLTTVALVVGSRFFTPANTVARAIALADPVVTSGGGLLRFEGFSACCSTYARVDLLPTAYRGDVIGKGTTNVDFNAPMRAALAQVSDARGLALSVGRDALTLRSGGHEVIERKVALPTRWLRSMLEVQSYQASMQRRFAVDSLTAQRFLRSLPKASTSRTPLWVAHGQTGMMSTTQPLANGVRVTDTRRLRLIQALLAHAHSLSVFADAADQASAWVLDFGTARLTLALSAETWRGFSGEGQALMALLKHDDDGGVAFSRVRAQLQWQAALDVAALAKDLALPGDVIGDTLRVLGSCGLVGFDVFDDRYFHRVLPLDLSIVEDLHPRLSDARALLQQNAVTVHRPSPLDASVASGGVSHRVREVDGELQCTCPWFAKHQGQRGPCKHVLAAEAMRSRHH